MKEITGISRKHDSEIVKGGAGNRYTNSKNVIISDSQIVKPNQKISNVIDKTNHISSFRACANIIDLFSLD